LCHPSSLMSRVDLHGWWVNHDSRRLIPLDGWHRPWPTCLLDVEEHLLLASNHSPPFATAGLETRENMS